MTDALEDPRDVAHRQRTHEALRTGATAMGFELTGPIQSVRYDRTAGASAHRDGTDAWLRVVGSAPLEDGDSGYFWSGNAEATRIQGVPKPVVVDLTEIRTQERWFRIEAMTRLPGEPVSRTRALTSRPDVPEGWFDDLERAVRMIGDTPTDRAYYTQRAVTGELRRYFGDWIDPVVTTWVPAHTDLAWTNLAGPQLGLYDWEGWGLAPAGYDAAMLHFHALLAPDVADHVYDRFRDVLDTLDGRRSQLLVAARILERDDLEGYEDLVGPVHQRADQILGRNPRTASA